MLKVESIFLQTLFIPMKEVYIVTNCERHSYPVYTILYVATLQEFYTDYLRMCRSYNVTQYEVPETTEASDEKEAPKQPQPKMPRYDYLNILSVTSVNSIFKKNYIPT